MCAQWVAKEPSVFHADIEDSDQTGRMPRLICFFAGRTVTLLVLSCRASFHGDLVMKKCLRPFSRFRRFKKSNCQLQAKECALSTGKLPRRFAQEQCGLGN